MSKTDLEVGEMFVFRGIDCIVVDQHKSTSSLSGEVETTFRKVIERDTRLMPDHIPLEFNGKTPLEMFPR